MEELDDPDMFSKEEKKVVTRQEYASRLQELKAEILQSWKSDDRVKALKLSIRVGIFNLYYLAFIYLCMKTSIY